MSDSEPTGIKKWNGAFQSSKPVATKAGYDQTKHNPLQFLHPCEILAAEIFVGVDKDPQTRNTYPKGKERKWSGLQSGAFGTRWRERMGFDLGFQHRKALEENPAWRHYVLQLKESQKEVVMARLKQDAIDAYDTYKWSRESAKAAGDYKEARLAAADHLDRIGATEKPREIQPNVVVILKGSVSPETVFSEPIEAEVIEMLPEDTSEAP